MSESFDTRIARSVDARLASEDARECDGGCGSVGPNGGRCQGCDHGQYTRAPTEEAALPSPSGTDAETPRIRAIIRELQAISDDTYGGAHPFVRYYRGRVRQALAVAEALLYE